MDLFLVFVGNFLLVGILIVIFEEVSVLQVYGKAHSNCDSLERDLKNCKRSRDPGYTSLDGYYTLDNEKKLIHFYRNDKVKYVGEITYPVSSTIFPLLTNPYYVKLKDESLVRLKRGCDLSKRVDKMFKEERAYKEKGYTFEELHKEAKKRTV